MNVKSKILIVDDETDLRLTLRDAFEYFGWEVQEAENGSVAYQKTLEQHFDCILSDIKMPVKNGVEFLAMLTPEYKAKTPIFMISAYSDYDDRMIKELGAQKLLSKPISIMTLMEELKVNDSLQK